MTTHIRECVSLTWRSRVAIVLLTLGLTLPAFAALGASVDSIQDDQIRLKANLKIIAGDAYAIHEMTLPTGTVVREYVSSAGLVFGVTWRGPFIPDMLQLLGSYFEQYSIAAKAHRESHIARTPLNIQQLGLVVQTGGHMRAYFGRAYDPALLPAGVGDNEVQ